MELGYDAHLQRDGPTRFRSTDVVGARLPQPHHTISDAGMVEGGSTPAPGALGAYKARGGVLGSARPECRNNLNEAAAAKGRALAVEARKAKAYEAYADLY